MQTFTATPKKWGSSLGIIIPKDVLEAEGVREGEEVEISVLKRKPSPVWDFIGIMDDEEMSTQEIMTLIDKELWNE